VSALIPQGQPITFSGNLHALLADLRLYRRLIVMRIKAQAQYRVNLALDFLVCFALVTLEFVAVLLYFGRFPTLLGWSVGDVTLLSAMVAVGFGLADIVGGGIDHFADVIRRGEFDQVLLRPAGTFIQIFGNDFPIRKLGRIAEGALLFMLATHLNHNLQWASDQTLAILCGIFSNMLIFMGILIIGATSCFWTIETTEIINLPFDGGRELSNYPLTIYHPALQSVFLFIIPLAFGAYIPACYVLGKSMPFGMPAWIAFAGPIVATAFFALTLGIWQFGVRHYQSTGS
jgi:ABC-2 type transport system permease protein